MLVNGAAGPHVAHTGLFKAFRLLKVQMPAPLSGIGVSYLQINALLQPHCPTGQPARQRIYGIAFPSNKELRAWDGENFDAVIRARNHRNSCRIV